MKQSSHTRYKITEIDPPRRVVLVGESPTIKAVDTIVFSAAGEGRTRINYTADLTLKGFRRPLIVLVGSALNELGRAAMTGLEKRLNSNL